MIIYWTVPMPHQTQEYKWSKIERLIQLLLLLLTLIVTLLQITVMV